MTNDSIIIEEVDLGPVAINRRLVIAAHRIQRLGLKPMIRIQCCNNKNFTINEEPTESNLKKYLP